MKQTNGNLAMIVITLSFDDDHARHKVFIAFVGDGQSKRINLAVGNSEISHMKMPSNSLICQTAV
jgi:hypothetical protein